MPAQAVAGTAAGGSNAGLAELLAPVFVSGDAEAGADALLWLGPASRIYGAAAGGSAAALALTVPVGLFGDAAAGSSAEIYGLGSARAIAGAAQAGSAATLASLATGGGVVAGNAAAGSDALLLLTVGQFVAGSAAGGSAAELRLNGDLPGVRDALPGEVPGTVNLVRNPSLEYADYGLTDWSATGADFVRVDGGRAWDGFAHGALDGAGTVAVRSLDGLGATGFRSWIGSIVVRGEPAEAWLEAEYDDATTDAGEAAAFDGSAEWSLLATEPLATDPAKVLRRLALVIDAAGAIDLDGAQIEEDRGHHATPFASGDVGGAHRWLGVPGLSPSLRDPGAAA